MHPYWQYGRTDTSLEMIVLFSYRVMFQNYARCTNFSNASQIYSGGERILIGHRDFFMNEPHVLLQ